MSNLRKYPAHQGLGTYAAANSATSTPTAWLRDAVLIASIAGYPLLGTFISVTTLSSLFASIPARGFVGLGAIALLFTARKSASGVGIISIRVFWLILVARLLWDWLVAGIEMADWTLVYFVTTCMIPAAAMIHGPVRIWNEDRLARYLLAIGTMTCIAAVTIESFGLAAGRSLLEDTSRLSFDTVNPITYGHIAVSTLLAALRWQAFSKRWAYIVLGTAITASLVVLTLAASRGPLVALGICILAISLCQLRYRWLLVGLVPVILLAMFGGDGSLGQRFSGIEDDPSALERLIIQSNAIEQFLTNPALGSAFTELEFRAYPHNPFIEAAMATGLGGLLLAIGIFALAAVRSIALLRQGHVLIPLLALQYFLAAQLSGSLFESNIMWIFACIVLAMTETKRRTGRTRQAASFSPHTVI